MHYRFKKTETKTKHPTCPGPNKEHAAFPAAFTIMIRTAPFLFRNCRASTFIADYHTLNLKNSQVLAENEL